MPILPDQSAFEAVNVVVSDVAEQIGHVMNAQEMQDAVGQMQHVVDALTDIQDAQHDMHDAQMQVIDDLHAQDGHGADDGTVVAYDATHDAAPDVSHDAPVEVSHDAPADVSHDAYGADAHGSDAASA